jgi:hypothetical protein
MKAGPGEDKRFCLGRPCGRGYLSGMDATALRTFIYDWTIGRGTPPASSDIGAHFGLPAREAREAMASLGIGKTLLCHPVTGEIWMAGPFAAEPTPYRVTGRRASWWANCAWDMLGIAAVVDEPVRIEAACTDCAEPMRLRASRRDGVHGEGIVHILVPAREWYRDIGFT